MILIEVIICTLYMKYMFLLSCTSAMRLSHKKFTEFIFPTKTKKRQPSGSHQHSLHDYALLCMQKKTIASKSMVCKENIWYTLLQMCWRCKERLVDTVLHFRVDYILHIFNF